MIYTIYNTAFRRRFRPDEEDGVVEINFTILENEYK